VANPDMKLQLIIEAISKTDAAFNALKKDLSTLQAQTAGMAAGGDAAGKALQDAGAKGAGGMKQVHDQAQRAHSMLGQMVQMAAIFGALAFAKKMAEYGIDYNKTLETSKLGIGAIMTSMGVITDQQGRVLQGQEKWNASQQLSVEAQRELEKIGMLTSASYTELVEVYQGILAPAFSAKMTFQETLEITGLLTNSVKALGLNTNQVKQEARDLIQGGISPASSSLATALGITDAMVKKWREQGTLAKELKERLDGFSYASEAFASTWDGAWSNFRDVAQRALGEGSKPLFDFIRQEVIKLTAEVAEVTRDASGKIIDIEVKPEVAARIRELANDLKKLIIIMESAVKWGAKLAEPAMYATIALGVGKIALAVDGLFKAIKAGEAVAKGGLLMRLLTNPSALAAVVAVLGLGTAASRGYDNVQLSKRADDIRGKADGTRNIEQFQGPQLREVLKKYPDATDDQIVKMMRSGAIRLATPSLADRYSAPNYKIHVNEEKARQVMDTGKAPFDLAGPDNKADDQQEAAKRLERAKQLREEWRRIYVDLAAEAQKAQPGMDAFDKRVIDINKSFDELLLKPGANKTKLEGFRKQQLDAVAADRQADEEKKRAEQEAKRIAAAEKVRDALRTVDEQIAGNSLSELDRQLAAQDKFYLESIEKLEDAGVDFATITAKEPEIYQAAQNRKLQILDVYNAKKREAEIAYQLSQVDYQEKGGGISAEVAAGERVRLTRQLLAGQEERLARLAEQGPAAEQAWLQERDAIAGTRDSLLQYELALRDLSDDMAGGLAEGFRSYVKQLGGGFKQMEGLAQATAQGMEQAFSDFFFDAMQGKLKSFGDYVTSFLSSIQRAISSILAQQAAEGIISGIGSMFSSPAASAGGGGGGGGGMTGGGSVAYAHSGGLILHDGGKVMVPRFHFGGLASDEVPAVLLRKERVLSIEQNQLFEKFANNARPGNVQVNVINQTGQQMEAEQSSPRFDGEKLICDVILKKMKSDPSFRNAMSSGGNF